MYANALEYAPQHRSLHAEWNSTHIARNDRTQTTIDTLFSLVGRYTTIAEVAENYTVDLTAEDLEMLTQFAASFALNKNSYKKNHHFWLFRPNYYSRKIKAHRAQKLKNLFATTVPTPSVSLGTAGHEIPTLFSTRQYNNHSRAAITE